MANDIPVGLRVPAQVPLDDKTHKINEAALQNLGIDNTLAYTYHKGLKVLCIEERTIYEWKEMEVGDVGLLPSNFVYPNGVIEYGIDYSNKAYNFVLVPKGETPPLQRINEGSGEGIIIRGRTAANYGNVGLNAVDLSFSDSASSVFGATEELSFATGQNNIASGYAASASGIETVSSGTGSHSEGVETISSGYSSHAEGVSTKATANSAHAQGSFTEANAPSSHAGGETCIANGNYSFSSGIRNTASTYAETHLGHWGTTVIGSTTTIVATDRLFNLGNGTDNGNRSNALTILKNGLATLPSVTNALITAEATGKAIVTKEYLSSVVNGSETKINPGTNITITGNGTVATPYVINASGGGSVSDATASVKGILKLTNDLGGTADLPTTPTSVHITGNENIQGIKTIQTRLDFGIVGSSIKGLMIGSGFSSGQTYSTLLFNKDALSINSYSDSDNMLTGNLGNIAIKSSGYGFASFSTSNIPLTQDRVYTLPATSGTLALENDNKQKVITYPADFTGTNYTLTNADNNYEIIINNGGTAVSITVPSGLVSKIGIGFTQKGTGDVSYVASGTTINNPIGLKIKGQYYQTYLSQEAATNIYYLGGNTKV